MYENASKMDATNEELLSHLFMAYVRVSDFKKQHHAAMQLYKVCKPFSKGFHHYSCVGISLQVRPKNPYYFWGAMSLVLQAVKAEEDAERAKKTSKEGDEGKAAPAAAPANIMLPLAERMLAKFHKDKNMESEQEMQLYIMILELQVRTESLAWV